MNLRRCNRGDEPPSLVPAIIATIFCLPCICLCGGCVPHLIKKAWNYERPEKREQRLVEKRRRDILRWTPRGVPPRGSGEMMGRCLTIPLPDPPQEPVMGDGMNGNRRLVQKTDDQSNSAFFKLPLEVRRQIYENVIGGYVFHIYFVEAYRKMAATRCRTHSPEICRLPHCRQSFKVKGALDEWGQSDLLALPMTCRRV